MTPKFDLCIVIPFYNEGDYILVEEYSGFVQKNSEVMLCCVNDGSKDNTQDVLDALKLRHPEQIEVLSLQKNQGKASAIRMGIMHCNSSFDFSFIAYLDADLAVSLEECKSICRYIDNNIIFCFGSRILKIGSVIERKWKRHLIGRVVATIVSEILTINVYDTQCGCKLFTRELSDRVFEKPFISRWLFDVEIFFRILGIYGKETALKKMLEVPLNRWIEGKKSSVKLTYFFRLWLDLYKIRKKYKHSLKS